MKAASHGKDIEFFKTREGDKHRRPCLDAQAERLVKIAGADANFFLCGPDGLMDGAARALQAQGAAHIFTNIYGTGTLETNLAALKDEQSKDSAKAKAGKCPMH